MSSKKVVNENKSFPDTIGNIIMRVNANIEYFITQPRIYGGVQLSCEEKECLKLAIKYALYKKLRSLPFKAELERAFTKLRWKAEIERKEIVDGGNELHHGLVYDIDTKEFNFHNIWPTDILFNKCVCMPPIAVETTEAKISYTREPLDLIFVKHCKLKSKINVDKVKEKGLKAYWKRKGEIVCYPTDE